MLTIENIRKDIGYKTGYEISHFYRGWWWNFKLVDGGLYGKKDRISLEKQSYVFHWYISEGVHRQRYKVVVNRVDTDGKGYFIWVQDSIFKDIIYEDYVKVHLFTNKEQFYNWMVKIIMENHPW